MQARLIIKKKSATTMIQKKMKYQGKYMSAKILSAVLCMALLSSCYYDKEEELYGTSCNTGNVTYSTTITGIINAYNCLSCHNGAVPSGGFSLSGYDNVKAKVTDGRLLGAISHTQGFAAMPQNAPKMSQCDINKVKAWVDAGALNN
jgi:hypothetical protein